MDYSLPHFFITLLLYPLLFIYFLLFSYPFQVQSFLKDQQIYFLYYFDSPYLIDLFFQVSRTISFQRKSFPCLTTFYHCYFLETILWLRRKVSFFMASVFLGEQE